ncbi:MAG: hypothetical protein E7264_00695 [Lachnospiraceae bacterium]|nr:hypothetical protein [Lachnospiraceae bacterium]
MDDKKRNLSQETNEKLDTGVIELVEFEEIRTALNKIDAKKETITKDTALDVKEETSAEKKDVVEDKKEASDEKKDVVEDKKETSDNKKDVVEDKKEPSAEKKDVVEDKKETSDNKKDVAEDKKETSDNKKDVVEDKKETSVEKKEIVEDKKDDTKDKKNLSDNIKEESTFDTPYEVKNVTKKKGGKKVFGVVFGIFVFLIVAAYAVGFVYFSNYFYPSVAINGVDVSNMDRAGAKKALDDFNKNYKLTLETIDGKGVEIAGGDIEMVIKLRDEFDQCFANQKAYLWFMNFMKHHEFSIGADASWNADALNGLYKDMKMLDKKMMTAPKDAYIGILDGSFAIVPEELGTTIKVDDFKKVVDDSLSQVLAHVNLKEAGCYDLPKIYSNDEALTKEFNEKKEFVGGVINIQMDDLTLEPGIELYDVVLEKKGDSYEVSKSKVQQYVKDLASEYDTMGKERNFTSTYGDGRQVKISGTAFGYELDQDATSNALYKALQEKKATTVEAVFKSKGYSLQGENDIGDTYIEVNLSEQKVVAYKDGKKIAEGDCVSGCEANGNGTCLGLYKIQDKLSPTVLRGQQKPVTKTVTKKKKGKKVKVEKTTMEYEYESPVTFWMQFNGGYGLHDAAGWRSVYGGSIYYYNGSHGCVNLPYSLAETLYKNFNVGDPVVVYFYDNENRK